MFPACPSLRLRMLPPSALSAYAASQTRKGFVPCFPHALRFACACSHLLQHCRFSRRIPEGLLLKGEGFWLPFNCKTILENGTASHGQGGIYAADRLRSGRENKKAPRKNVWIPDNKQITRQVGKNSFITQAGSTPTGRAAFMPPTGCGADGKTREPPQESACTFPTAVLVL